MIDSQGQDQIWAEDGRKTPEGHELILYEQTDDVPKSWRGS